MNRFNRGAVVLALAAVLSACGGAASGGPSVDPAAADVSITAVDMAFDASTITAPAGESFSLVLINEDAMPHNVAIYTDATKSEKLFEGDLVTDGTAVYEIPALAAGEYFFDCSLHPDMTGTLVVEG